MYCRNCGLEIDDNASVCVHCGVNASFGDKFCQNCGKTTVPHDQTCMSCGVQLKGSGKDWLTTLLLSAFLGYFGVHRFYTGHIGIGVAQLLTGGGCGIWYIIDMILIVTNNYKDSEGNPLSESKI